MFSQYQQNGQVWQQQHQNSNFGGGGGGFGFGSTFGQPFGAATAASLPFGHPATAAGTSTNNFIQNQQQGQAGQQNANFGGGFGSAAGLVAFPLANPVQNSFGQTSNTNLVPYSSQNQPAGMNTPNPADLHIFNQLQSAKQMFWNRIELLCLSDELSDVVFVFEKGSSFEQRIPAHKFILSVASDVFAKLLAYNEMERKISGRKSAIQEMEITDERIEISAFKSMLVFIYSGMTGEVLTNNSVWNLLYLAKMYMIPPLEEKCVEYLKQMMCPQNVFEIFEICLDYDLNESLLDESRKYIRQYAREVMGTPEFLEISSKCLGALLNEVSLNITEIELFKQVVNWAVSSCKASNVIVSPENLRAVLGINFHSIRFTTISRDDFFSVVVPTRILTDEEVENMLMIIDEEQTATAGPSDHQEEQQDIGQVAGPSNQQQQKIANPQPLKRLTARSRVFSDDQLRQLEAVFAGTEYPTKTERQNLAASLGVRESQIQTWFLSRRRKWRSNIGGGT